MNSVGRHVLDFEARHITNEEINGLQFPQELNHVFNDVIMARQSALEWLDEKLKVNETVDSTTIVSENLLTIVRTDGTQLNVTKSPLTRYSTNDIKDILSTS